MAMRTLARSESSKKRATFDEKNLDENEKIKLELAPTNITEPKTPYHAPLQGDLDEVAPLSLDGETAAGKPAGMTAEQHAEFEKHRKEHYKKEAEALKKAAAADDDDEEEEQKS
eukprot:CAMPEP_0202360596 /NCGR_PEP_ID=MMETSP1126-20121109/13477_1 /ASSEMBLY_ACC=CAM_ASM_000457 /TAXON_ID=3047 /ORGANISM="Dunaliella tertiolecta, Strain CCMP1320" /LENGTH=113 /DNA_ID=CAMNT_0048954343 /DNA_START=56 /DNA_END=397 /DNA_ORIENTATION=+